MARPGLNEYDDASKVEAPNGVRIEHQNADGSPSTWQRSFAKDNTGPEKTVVYDQDDELLLEYYAHADGPASDGAMPDFIKHDDLDKPENRRARLQTDIAARIAQWAVTEARRRLPLGPLNQAFHFPGDDPNGAPSYVMNNKSPGYHEHLIDLFQQGLAWDEKGKLSGFEGLLANFIGTLQVGAGVCANISALTAGLATLTALPTWQVPGVATTILRCSHAAGHSFSVVSYGASPFIVADPWLAEPRLVLFEDNCFGPDGVKTYEKIVVHRRLDVPFGIPLMALWNHPIDGRTNDNTPPAVKNLLLTPERLRMIFDDYRQCLVAPAHREDMRRNTAEALFKFVEDKVEDGEVVEEGGWRANENAKRVGSAWARTEIRGKAFHANECLSAKGEKALVVWEQISSAPGIDHYWKEGDEERPIHTVDEWGEDARHEFEAGRVPPPSTPKVKTA